MNIVLTLNDLNLITNFYRKLNILTEDRMKNIIMKINSQTIIVAHISNNEITSMISANLIKNNYYLDKFLYIKYNSEELLNLLEYLLDVLKDKPNGIRIICDNYPYDESTNYLLLSARFKYNYIDYICESSEDKIDNINFKFAINDKSNDVIEYLKNKYASVIEKTNKYLNLNNEYINPEINVSNLNLAVIRDDDNLVIGVASFTIVGENMFIHSLYGETEEVLDKLIKLIRSITSKPIEIGISPVRTDLINFLEKHSFIRNQADYFRNVSEN